MNAFAIALERALGRNLRFDRALRTAERKAGHEAACIAGRSARRFVTRPLHHRHDWRFLSIRLTFSASSGWRIVWMRSGSPKLCACLSAVGVSLVVV
ncbi:hypothetical protein FJ934_17890 [Mesorhizobium sp. B2-4-12]|nr:hypothetical protein FJ934_17890 [Mesorhizobium sp. B2-4-12]